MSELASTRQMRDGSSGDSGVTGRERRDGRERRERRERKGTEKIRMIFEAMDKQKKVDQTLPNLPFKGRDKGLR